MWEPGPLKRHLHNWGYRMKKTHTEAVDQLFEAVLSLKTKEECYTFFEDICTPNELASLSQRFAVGLKLLQKQTYQEISKTTGASTVTISRVNRLLSDENEGIEMAARRIGVEEADTEA